MAEQSKDGFKEEASPSKEWPPGHKLVEEAETLVAEINKIKKDAEEISICNPFRGYLQWKSVHHKKKKLEADYADKLSKSLGAMRGTTNCSLAMTAGYVQTLYLGQSLTATLLLQDQWQKLVGVMDRKVALMVASFGIYIAVTSLLLTCVFGIVSVFS